ncbi:hypothetical protein DY000_02010543 [Brassica cretica]|uniref:Uncharacterized protein n=1 Tax=Brassica cretica TaxID=69181 RepID=A0ABQ7C8H6_BRACR|nr:hypothetical protein DY000_02010543 [Brassica cretica]
MKLSDDEIGEDDRVKEDGVDTIEEEKQDDEAEEKDQVAGELVKKQGARKRQFKPTVGAGGTSVLRMVQAELANAKEITLNSWRRRELVWFHFYSVMLGGIQGEIYAGCACGSVGQRRHKCNDFGYKWNDLDMVIAPQFVEWPKVVGIDYGPVTAMASF